MEEGQRNFFEKVLHQAFQEKVEISSHRSLGGGCINQACRLETNRGNLFLKWNSQNYLDMFEKESKGLKILDKHFPQHIPDPILAGTTEQQSFLLMEFLESGPMLPSYWETFGRSLASLHQNVEKKYGLDHDNYIGRLEQFNSWKEDWIDFFIEMRLEKQLKLALDNHLVDKSFSNRFRKIYPFLSGILPIEPPSLLHGDLWSGNVVVGPDGNVGIIDPAVYYGSREIELAFTQLFGGFDRQFYESYQESYPLSPGYLERVPVYNLYPLMVHVNLFGASYLSGVEHTIAGYQ